MLTVAGAGTKGAAALGMARPAYMSEIFLVGGGNDEPDPGLPTC